MDRFVCPHCGQKIRANGDLRGRTIACPGCGEKTAIPPAVPDEGDPLVEAARREAPAPAVVQLTEYQREILGYLRRAEERSLGNRRSFVISLVVLFFLWLGYSFLAAMGEGQRRAEAERQKNVQKYIEFRDSLRGLEKR